MAERGELQIGDQVRCDWRFLQGKEGTVVAVNADHGDLRIHFDFDITTVTAAYMSVVDGTTTDKLFSPHWLTFISRDPLNAPIFEGL